MSAPAATDDMLDAAPIFALTVRQFLSGKAVRIVAAFALIPAVFAAIYALDSGGISRLDFMDGLFQGLIAPTLLPIATLILATNALGNEIEDRTMVYLVLKPISRARIVLEKFTAVVLTAVVLQLAGLVVTFLIVARGAAGDNLAQLPSMAIAGVFGVLGYGALFMAVSLIVPRALLAGVMYTLLWESLFGRFIPGIRLVSVRHYIQSIYVRLMDHPDITVSQAMQFVSAVVTILVLTTVAMALASWRLRTMNLE
ncbi:MAG TPA: ABC transporter permease subunit [Thermomicrobiales bacterium]|nr:ABC transporter permease subunit [Thermomicrobiales bacterium]